MKMCRPITSCININAYIIIKFKYKHKNLTKQRSGGEEEFDLRGMISGPASWQWMLSR